MFATDRDLIAFDPLLFEDYQPRAQVLFQGECNVIESALDIGGGIPDFTSQRIGIGSVVLVGRTPLEVMKSLGPLSLSVSRIRPDGMGPLIMPENQSGISLSIVTFTAQLQIVYFQLLRMAGIEPQLAGQPGQLTATMIMNPGALCTANILGALSLIYLGASAGQGADSSAAQRGLLYQRRFESEVERCIVHLDTNGDGRADAIRKLSGGPMLR
jgi:hypothetical protein